MPILDLNNKKEVELYNDFVKNNKHTNFMQDIAWSKVKNNWESEIVYIKENNIIVATMMILIKKITKFNSSIIYAPSGPVGDIFNRNILNQLIKEIDSIAYSLNAFVFKFDPKIIYSEENVEYIKSLNLILSRNDSTIQPLYNMSINTEERCLESIVKDMSSNTRYSIKYSMKKNVEVYSSKRVEDLKIFYDLYTQTTTRNKFPCRTYEYFESLLEAFDDNEIKIYIAKHDEDYLAASIAINYGKEVTYLYGSSSEVKRNLRATYLLQYMMIKWAVETKCKKYNLGGVIEIADSNTIYKFKSGFCKNDKVTRNIGEINKIYNPYIFFMYDNFLPIFRKISRRFKGIHLQ